MSTLPRVTDRERLAEQRVRLTLELDPRATVFEGHFAGQPILPGVAQVDWAARLAHRHLDCIGVFSGMKKIKFHRIIRPSTTVSLLLEWQDGNLCFEYRNGVDNALCSSGCLSFAQ